jgi:Bacterial Ig-like domain (group 2)
MRYPHAALRHTRRVSSWFLTCLIVFGVGCSDPGPTPPPISINIETVSLEIGGTVQLSARNATTTVTWTSSNNAVAAVLSTGFVTAVGPGTATITATAGSASASSVVTVLAPPLIALSGTTVNFTARAGSTNPAAQTITISNGGPGTLPGIALSTIQYAGGQGNWLTASLNGTSATATQTASLQLTAAVAGLAPGVYTAVVPITATGAANSPQNVNVTFTVTPRPTLELSRPSVAISAVSGAANPAPETVNLTSSTSAPAAGLGTSIAYNEAAQAGWLTAEVNPNTTPSTLTLRASAGARPAGTYTAIVSVTSTDASNAPRQVNVSFTIAPAPRIDANPATLSFGAPLGGAVAPTEQTIQVSNGGGGTLTGLTARAIYTNGNGWLTVTPTSVANGGSVRVVPNIAGLAAGTYAAVVRIEAAGASNSPRDVPVSLIISSQPTIAVSPVSLTFASTGATPAPQVVTITNSGGGTFSSLSTETQYASGNNWLVVSLSTGVSPVALTVQPNIAGLAAGTYNATVRVLSPGASNTPVGIPVQLTITTPPLIMLSRSNVTFNAVIGGSDPLAEAVTITNGGGGSLTGLAASIAYSFGNSWLSTQFTTTPQQSTLMLTAARGSLAVGTYTATVNVLLPGASNSPRPIAVTFNVTQPTIAVDQAAPPLTQASGNGNATVFDVNISGNGGQVVGLQRSFITFTGPAPNNNWLTATLIGTSSPAILRLTANAGTPGAPRTPGVYTATVRLTSTNASNSVDVNVTFTVEVSLTNNLFNQVYTDYCSSCHFAGGSYPNLSTTTLFRNNMVNVVPTGNTVTYPLAATYNRVIVAGNASQSYLMYMLNKAAGARPMPTSVMSTVPQSLRDLMRDWINQGAKNN